jgi:uncharacterized hydrophobic protein (TIGR00271 family)
VLIFAIFIASIGLNVNSAAVVIGAMLISPLMGPIMGVGYGAGINDSALVRSSLFNLFLAALISLITSTAYFWITPLTQAHSELLARTTPTIWDVLIAFFGGLAGAIGITRRTKSNLVPGVAIATALMPPLCTAGYGLATGNMAYFGGALYLFSINCVFIAYATILMVRVMHIPLVADVHHRSKRQRRIILGLVVLMTLGPSIYLGTNLVQKEVFSSRSERFVAAAMRNKSEVLVLSHSPDYAAQALQINLVGRRLSAKELMDAEQRLPDFGLSGVKLVVVQSGQDLPDMNVVKKDMLAELFNSNRDEVAKKDNQIAVLSQQLQVLQNEKSAQLLLKTLFHEISQQFPQATYVSVSAGLQTSAQPRSKSVIFQDSAVESKALERATLVVQLELPNALSTVEQERLRQGWRIRAGLLSITDVQLLLKTPPLPKSRATRNQPVRQ